MEDDDIKLMLAFKKGNESCFEKILNKYEKPLINFIFRFIGDRAEAEDLAQEVFLKIYQSATNYKPSAKFSTWLYKIATNLCIDYQRKKKIKTFPLDKPIRLRRVDEGEIIREIPDLSQETPDVSIEKMQISETIRFALLSLPANQRLALSLKVYENKPYQEISKILNRSIPAVKLLIFRARQNLRKNLRKNFFLTKYSYFNRL